MNIFEMLSFDFQEFVTSPAGILIIIGIVCLLVGIVIFLKEGKKTAKPVEEVKEEAAPAAEPTATVEEVKEEAAPVVEEAPAVEPVVEQPVEATPIVVNATTDGVTEVPVPEVSETLNITEPAPAVVSPVEEAKPETLDAPVVEAPVVESLDDAQPAVYGGASPEVTNVVAEEAPKEIYGGASPLENTAPIPTAEVAAPAVEPVAPAVEPVAPAVEAPAEAPAAPAPEAPKEEIEKLEF